MNAPNEASVHEGDRSLQDANACQDGFRYKIVEEDGRYRFAYIQAVTDIPCAGKALSGVLENLSGAWLDELSPEALAIPGCEKGDHCYRGLSEIVRDLQELLLQ